MKTKPYVVGIGSCLLLVSLAYFKPYVKFSPDPTEQSAQNLMASKQLLNYEKSSIPGLEIKTPAKIAVVNKLAVAKMKKVVPKKAIPSPEESTEKTVEVAESRAGKAREARELSSAYQPVSRFDKNAAEEDERDNDVAPYIASNDNVIVNAPKPGSTKNAGRTVINYSAGAEIVEHTSNRFPHENQETELAIKDESANKFAAAEKAEKSYSFRGKTSVKSSLFKYIPPFWDGFSEETGLDRADRAELLRKAQKIAAMARKNGYNTEFAFLVDMSVKSNKNRFFVVNLKTFTIEMSALVAQGRGSERLNLDKDYSNRPGSNCSSLGVYKVGKPYEGDFGRSYKLYGMDASNKNAYARAIVLHAMGTIPNRETNFPIWQSEGCPSVSPSVLEALGAKIDASKKPVLLWMYDDTYLSESGKSASSIAMGR
ncbi:MAG: murein L,D-transpeptidase catalytic domain family protein [Bacteroidetes bacterium]|nr:murein L,D-transpeptidase catalytic domain family protein [Bacteroidota bacterium]